MKEPVHILVECPELTASVRLGVMDPLRPLELQQKCVVRFQETKRIRKADLIWCDVLVTVRGCEKVSFHIAQAVKASGRTVLYFLDDDLLNVPRDVASGEYFEDAVMKESIRQTIGLCDVLWTINAFTCEKYARYCKARTFVGNVPAKVLAEPEMEQIGPVRLLYAGSIDHEALVSRYLSPALRRLCTEYGDRLEVTFVGADPHLSDLPNVQHYPFLRDYTEYVRLVCSGKFQIGLAVVGEQEFYRCKYYNKFIEYSSIGAVGIYTDSEPYTLVVTDGVNGFLCKNSADAWYAAIKRVVEHPQLRNACARAASDDLRKKHHASYIAEVLEEGIPELVTLRQKERTQPCAGWIFGQFYWGRVSALFRARGWGAVPEISKRVLQKTRKLLRRKET